MRSTAMWVLLGVFVLLGGQPSEAGTGDHTQTRAEARQQPRDEVASSSPVVRYVAIGDSFTAGSGIRPGGDQGGCRRSERSYPYRLAELLDARVRNVACGGATTGHAEVTQPTAEGSGNPPQLAPLDRRTDLVTVSLGVNDAGYGPLLHQCVTVAATDPQGAPCWASFQAPGGDQILSAIPEVGQRVERLLKLVQRKAPNARVVVVGYPQPVPRHGTCPELPFAAGDYAYVAQFFAHVDGALRGAARRVGVTFVDVMSASAGHDVCAGTDAWVLGATPSPRTMPFHPFANEQRAVAALIEDALAPRTVAP